MTTSQGRLGGLTVSIVGSGRVGASLASWVVSVGGRLVSIASRDGESARLLAARLGGRATPVERLATGNEDLLLIAVSDASIEPVADSLGTRAQAPVALHTCGRKTAESLSSLRARGTAVGSIHPLMAFPAVISAAEAARGTVFGIDGDPPAQALARQLVEAWHGHWTEIPGDRRELYHLGATIAAGGVMTLLASAVELGRSLGLSRFVADGYLRLAAGALDQAKSGHEVAAAITGPVARGDLDSFQKQVDLLREVDPELASLVDQVADRTLLLRRKLIERAESAD